MTTKNKIEKELILNLLVMAETNKHYLKGEQWAVNAVSLARMILGRKDPRSLFITESNPHGITVQSADFLKKNLSKLGSIVKVRGYKDEELDYWIEFSDQEENIIRVSGFSWGYGGEGPNGLANACKLVGIPLIMQEIIGLPDEKNWEVNKVGKIVIE